jgi:hypothetical protein
MKYRTLKVNIILRIYQILETTTKILQLEIIEILIR